MRQRGWHGGHYRPAPNGLALVLLVLSAAMAAWAENAPEAEKPKEKPFKYSAWCAFRELSGSTAEPAPDPETEHTRPGSGRWGGFGRRGQWTQLIVELKNTTKETPYRGTVTVVLNGLKANNENRIPYSTTYVREFELPPESLKQYPISVLCPIDGWPGTEGLRVQITANGLPREDRTIFLRDLDQYREELVVVVSESAGSFRFLGTAPTATPDGVEDEDQRILGRQVAVVTPAELPVRWHDLRMANLIILDGPPRETLSPEQWAALKSYVQSGGQILITAGRDPSRLKGPLEELAGITVRGMTETESLEAILPDAPFFIPADKRESRLPMVEVKVNQTGEGSAVALLNPKTKLVEMSQRHYGGGTVVFLPFSLNDSLLRTWSGVKQIPVELLERSHGALFGYEAIRTDNPGVERSYAGRFTSYEEEEEKALPRDTLPGLRAALDDSFANDTPVRAKSRETVLSFLLFYLLFAVPGNFLLFGWLKRREVAWLAVPLWTAGFSVLAYGIGYMGQTGELTVNQVTVVEVGARQESAAARTFLGLYAPARNDYRLEFTDAPDAEGGAFATQAAPGHLLNAELANNRRLETTEMVLVDRGDALSIERLLVQQRSTRRLEVIHRVPLGGGIDFAAVPDGENNFRLRLVNQTGRELFYPVFFHDGKAVDLVQGDTRDVLRAGDALDISTRGRWREGDAAFFGREFSFRSVRGTHARNRTRALMGYMRSRLSEYTGGVFCAWVEGSMLPVRVGPTGGAAESPGVTEGITLLVMPLPDEKAAPVPTRLEVTHNRYFPGTQNNLEWQKPDEDGVEMSADARTATAYIRVPFNPALLRQHSKGFQAQLRFRVGLKPGSKARVNCNATVEVYVEKAPGSYQWEELTDTIPVNGVAAGMPVSVTVPALRLNDPSRRPNNAFHFRIRLDSIAASFGPWQRNGETFLRLEKVEMGLQRKR